MKLKKKENMPQRREDAKTEKKDKKRRFKNEIKGKRTKNEYQRTL